MAITKTCLQSNVWSGLEKNQIFGRIIRPGQMRDVLLYNIVAPDGIDLALMGYSESKSGLSDRFMMSQKQLQQAYLAITAPEVDDGEEIELEQEPTSSKVKATKVVSRKRKHQAEDKSNGVAAELNPASPAKRTKTSGSKKNTLSTDRGGAKKSWSSVGPARPQVCNLATGCLYDG